MASVNKGDTSAKIEAGLDIVSGDRLAFAATSLAWRAGDKLTVQSYDIETGDVTFTSGFLFYHFGAEESTGEDYNGVDMRGEVLLLTRNIKIEGTTEDNWGCQLLTADVSEYDVAKDKDIDRKGQLIMKNVEMERCSQRDNYAGIRFENVKSEPSII